MEGIRNDSWKYGLFAAVSSMACFYAAYAIKAMVKYGEMSEFFELFSSIPWAVLMLFWFGAIWYCGQYARNSYLSFKALIRDMYPNSSDSRIEAVAKAAYSHRIMKLLWLPIGGFPLAFYVFEHDVPTTPMEWILIALCLATSLYFYKSTRRRP